jgi:hypothetical protein
VVVTSSANILTEAIEGDIIENSDNTTGAEVTIFLNLIKNTPFKSQTYITDKIT